MMSGSYVEYFGWLGFHHLWIGCLLAGCCWLFNRLAKHQGPLSRYHFWGMTLLILSLLPMVAWIPRNTQLPANTSMEVIGDLLATQGNGLPIATETGLGLALDQPTLTSVQSVSTMERLANFLPSSQLMITALLSLWVVGLSVGLISLGFAFFHLMRLKRHVQPVEDELQEWFTKTTETLKLKRRITLGYSPLATVPMAAGLFKPCILLPARLGQELAEREKRPIILHELAHLMRADDWVNLVQRLVQAMFFYHPGIRLAAREFELAREMACDAWAIEYSGKKKVYAASMLRLLETSKTGPSYALGMSAVGGKTQLMRRMEQMLDSSPRRTSREKWLRPVLLVLFPMSLLAFAQVAPPPPIPKPAEAPKTSAEAKAPLPAIIPQPSKVAPNGPIPSQPVNPSKVPRAPHTIAPGSNQVAPMPPVAPKQQVVAPTATIPAPDRPSKQQVPRQPVQPKAPKVGQAETAPIPAPDLSQWLSQLQADDHQLIQEWDEKVEQATSIQRSRIESQPVKASSARELRRRAQFEMGSAGVAPSNHKVVSIEERKRQLQDGAVFLAGQPSPMGERPLSEQEKEALEKKFQEMLQKLESERLQLHQKVVKQEAEHRQYLERLVQEKRRMQQQLEKNSAQLQKQQQQQQLQIQEAEAYARELQREHAEAMEEFRKHSEQKRLKLERSEEQRLRQQLREFEQKREKIRKRQLETSQERQREVASQKVLKGQVMNHQHKREALKKQRQRLERELKEVRRQLKDLKKP